MKVNSSAGWKEEGLGGSNARPPRVYGPAVFNDSDPHCNDISVYYRMVDAQERSPMISPPKIKCKSRSYSNGKCLMLPAKYDPALRECLKQNCIYYDGETNVN